MRHPVHSPLDTLAPFAAFGRLRQDLDRLMSASRTREDVHVPSLMLRESEEAYEVRFPLPGANPEKLDVAVENDVLKVSGERSGIPDEATRRYTVERLTGRFERELQLPAHVDAGAVVAEYEHGVLRVLLPKAKEALARKVAVSWK